VSLEHSPARTAKRASAEFNDPSLTVDQFLSRREHFTLNALPGMVRRLGPEVLPGRRDSPHYPSRASGVAE
jgi:hypothetical protein